MTIYLTVSLDSALVKKVEGAAKREKRSRSAMVGVLLAEALEARKAQAKHEAESA